MTHVGRARGKAASNLETTGTDRVTDTKTGSSYHGMWVEQERPLALCPWQKCPAPYLLKEAIGGSSGRSHLQGIFLNTVLHMKRWNRSA